MSSSSDREMPFLDHLEELRRRLAWSVGALAVAFGVGVVLHARFDLVTLLKWPACPYLPPGCQLQVFSPADSIAIPFTVALGVAFMLASPVLFYHLWAFIAPALHAHERRLARGVLAGGLVLFGLGAALAHVYVLPATLRFAAQFGGPSLVQNYAAREYFSLVVTLALTFGVAFELPLVLMALAALGLVTPAFLRTYRRQALVLCVAGAAIITPGDGLFATVFLVPPLYALYELGILLAGRAMAWRARGVQVAALALAWWAGRARRHAVGPAAG